MTDQLALVQVAETPRPLKPLTVNQQHAWDIIRHTPGGVTAEQVGAYIHSTRDTRPHPTTDPCQWCEKTGRQTVESKGLAPFVTYSNADGNRVYRPRRPADRVRTVEPTREPTEAELAINPFAGL